MDREYSSCYTEKKNERLFRGRESEDYGEEGKDGVCLSGMRL